mmetsp:Transcript_3291/g.6002  ORF Transcript_3291/g.6002 Transcript_3291/m.6002 type:complete len:211 (-) Transcript_3291:13-645(-)
MRLWRGGVVIVDEGEGEVRSDAHQPGKAVLTPQQGPVLGERGVVNCCLKREVKAAKVAFRCVCILRQHFGGGECRVADAAIIPPLRNAQLSPRVHRRVDVLFHVLGAVAEHEVEAEGREAQVTGAGHVVEPRLEGVAHLLVGMVHIGGSGVDKLFLRVASACQVGVGVVTYERPRSPVETLVVVRVLVAEEDPVAVLVLAIATAVVEDDV